MSSAHITFDTTGDKIARRVRKMRPSAVRNLFAAATRDDVISLSGGMPAVSLLPEEDIRRATLAAIESPEARAVSLQYGPTDGLAGLRAVLADMMRDLGIRVKADQVLVTTGAQQALTLIAEAFIDPDDIIITEGPTYLGALQAFSAFEPDVRAIPFDEDGMRMDLLEEELKRIGKDNPRLKFCYTIPNFQNPGGVTMTAERRRRLLELAREYNFMVVEDDPYGRLRYDGGHQVPLKAMDDSVIYLGTISKMLGPGLRTGWIAAPEAVLARINLVKQGADLCGSAFGQCSTTSPMLRGSARCRSSSRCTRSAATPCWRPSTSSSHPRPPGRIRPAACFSGLRCRTIWIPIRCLPKRWSRA